MMTRLAVVPTIIGGALLVFASGTVAAAPCGMGKPYAGAYAPPMPAYPGYFPYTRGPYGVPRPPMMRPYGPAAGMPMAPYQAGMGMPAPPMAADAGPMGTDVAADLDVGAATDAAAVTISGMRFDAPTVVVKKGGIVTWTSNDAMPHTVTANNGSFGSPQLSNGATWSQTFDAVGTFGYYCALHPGMRGTVVVVE
jgi:plastocyanin